MTLAQLRSFAAVAQAGSFTEAARRTRVAQSGLSAQVRQLETALGQSLFDRSARRVRLSPAGSALLPHALAVLEAAAALREAADGLAGAVRGTVRFGMVVGCTIPQVLDALGRVHAEHPGLAVTVTEAGSDDLLERVRQGTLDVAVAGWAAGVHSGLLAVPVIEEPLAALVPHGDPLAGRAEIAFGDLAGRSVLCLARGTGIRAALDAGCRAAGVDLAFAVEANAPDAVIALARRGLGIAVLTPSIADIGDWGTAVPIAGSPPSRLGIVTRRQARTPASTSVLATALRDAFRASPPG
ncbi:MAG: LysR family transcriptional regulator [Thermoleophilia bacterium]|nr:LysR family transcriptional regulator [Thermoleophilia bacterium]